jgi:hypothetical protein
LQQSELTVQICPYVAQVPVPPSGIAGPLSGAVLPASAGGGEPPHGPHIPRVLPGATVHDDPGQQSALLVHVPQAATHCVALHT